MEADFLQYGALGLLGVVLAGVFWYVRSVEHRQAARDQYDREERLKTLEIQVGTVRALTALAEKLDGHEAQVASRCRSLATEHEQIRDDLRALERAIERIREDESKPPIPGMGRAARVEA